MQAQEARCARDGSKSCDDHACMHAGEKFRKIHCRLMMREKTVHWYPVGCSVACDTPQICPSYNFGAATSQPRSFYFNLSGGGDALAENPYKQRPFPVISGKLGRTWAVPSFINSKLRTPAAADGASCSSSLSDSMPNSTCPNDRAEPTRQKLLLRTRNCILPASCIHITSSAAFHMRSNATK